MYNQSIVSLLEEKKSRTDFDALNAVTYMWEIWYVCNYRCSYCPFEMAKAWDRIAKNHLTIKPSEWIACWERVDRKSGPAHIYFIGGEPLLYPGVDEILQSLSRRHYLSIITNLSLSIEAARKLAQGLPPERVRFGASFHPEFSNLEQFLEKLTVFKEAGFQIWVSIVAWPALIGKIKNYKDAFNSHGIHADTQTFFGQYQGKSYPQAYTLEEKTAIAPDISNILKPYGLEQQSTLGKLCESGYIYSKILANGDVYRCGSVVHDQNSSPMGNILNPDFELSAGPTPCPRHTCTCGESAYLWENRVKNLTSV